MASPSQQVLPLDTSASRTPRRAVAYETRPAPSLPVRWGAAIVNPSKSRQNPFQNDFTVGPREPRRTTVWTAEEMVRVEQDIRAKARGERAPAPEGPNSSERAPNAGATFAESRFHHAFDLFGACMMIAGFLAFAMFA